MLLYFYAFALSGRGYYIFISHTQGAASLALDRVNSQIHEGKGTPF